MKKLITVSLLLLFTKLHAQDTVKIDAALNSATVYFGYGAELTHAATANVNRATRQIVISLLSSVIDINSLQVSVPESVALLSQRFVVFMPQGQVTVANPSLKKLEDSIKIWGKEQKRNRNQAEIERETLEKVNKLIEIALKENNNKTISSEEALRLINANTAKIETAKQLLFQLDEAYDILTERIAALRLRVNEMQKVGTIAPKPYGQLILQVVCSNSGNIPVSLSYFTGNAGFTPSYDLRVNTKTNELKLVYKAAITQTTGVNWTQVKLTLSTSNPSRAGNAPIFTPWFLQAYVKPLYDKLKAPGANSRFENNIQSLARNDKALMEEVVVTGYGTARKKEMDFSTESVEPANIQKYTTLTESQLNTSFDIELPYDINSDGELHSVTIREQKIHATLKNFAIPKLDSDAYLLAAITDWQKLDLLPGIANIIMDNTYIGKSVIDPNSTADTLNLSLGKDKRLALKRTAVKDYSSTKLTGTNTIQLFAFELTVKNNKTIAADILLKDQYPVSSIKDIEIKLEQADNAMVNAETGILSWDLHLQPGESRKLRFSYRVKYPREIKITNL